MALQPDSALRLLVGLDEICDWMTEFEKVRILFGVLASNPSSYRSRDESFGTDTSAKAVCPFPSAPEKRLLTKIESSSPAICSFENFLLNWLASKGNTDFETFRWTLILNFLKLGA